MGKPKPSQGSNKKPKSSVKINNKKQNKANKSKKVNKKLRKALTKGIQKDNELLVNVQFSRVNNNKNKKNQNDNDGLDYLDESRKVERRSGKRKLNNDLNDESIEINYKIKSSLLKQNKKDQLKSKFLPIKTQAGQLVKNNRLEEVIDEENQNENDSGLGVDGEEKLEMIEEKPKSMIEIINEKKILFEKNREKIAHLSHEILQNPQGELKKLRELRSMLLNNDVKYSYILRKFIVVSLCEVFKDIVPSYKIRTWTEKENQQKVSKDVEEVKSYEESLLKQYKLYIDYLSDSLKGSHRLLFKENGKVKDEEAVKQFATICVRSLSDLIERLSHFNHSSDIIEIIVQQLTSKIKPVAELANESIRKLLNNDKELRLSLEIVQKIAKVLKQKSFGVKPEVLDIFLSLKLKEIHIVEEKAKKLTHKEKMKLSRADRKKLKEKEQLENELEEKKSSDRLRDKSKLQARILEQIFMVYFKILKKAPNLKLIPSVLEGLSKFAHLINLDFFDDLVKIMHQMIESDTLALRSKLHCIKTVFIVLSGQGEALTIDPIKFYSSLYTILTQLNAAGSLENTILLAECIEMMFMKRRKQIPTARLLAFIKRLTICSIHCEPASSAILLNLVRKLANINKSSDLLFDNEYQDSGIYNPELNEPDYTNSQNTSLWELHLLRRYYNKTINLDAIDLLKETSIGYQESKMNSQEIANKIKQEEEDIFNQEININKKAFKK